MKGSKNRLFVIISVIILIAAGHYIADFVRTNNDYAWLYVIAFYGGWIILSLFFLLKVSDLKQLFRRGIRSYWNLLPLLFIIPTIIFIFIPNIHLIRLDSWLAFNLFICLVNPWLEEIYWRGLISMAFKNNLAMSFSVSCFGFALSHPLVFGVNSRGVSGFPAFIGAFAVGAVWWFCLQKTKSLRGNVFTHFIMDVAGMAVYILANKAILFL